MGNKSSTTSKQSPPSDQLRQPIPPSKLAPRKKVKLSTKQLQTKLKHAAKTGSLNLVGTGLKQIPAEVWKLSNLRVLDLSYNKLQSIPKDIVKLTKLKRLILTSNPIREPLPDLEYLSTLQELDICECQLKQCPAVPSSLKILRLSYNDGLGFERIQKSAPTELEELDMAATRLLEIPEWLQSLAKLQQLNVSHNSLCSLGTVEIWKHLPKLQVLLAANNKIPATTSAIPKSLLEETAVHKLILTGNPITQKQIQELPGAEAFLERRKMRINKGMAGHVSALQDRALCGLD